MKIGIGSMLGVQQKKWVPKIYGISPVLWKYDLWLIKMKTFGDNKGSF